MDPNRMLSDPKQSPVGRWVECHWNFQARQGFPHPGDTELIRGLAPFSWISAECIGVEGPYFVLKVRDTVVRLRPFSIVVMPTFPKFKHGDLVRTILGDSVKTSVEATVSTPQWHHKNNEWCYFLEGNARRRHRRYREQELVLVSP